MTSSYVLFTAAKNEAAYIGEAIQSVLRQTLRPSAWFIMDDGSTDRTAEIVREHAVHHPFIRLHSAGGTGRNFGSQYKAIQAAYQMAKDLDFGYVGVQDADIAPESPDYYQTILTSFEANPRLGIAGGYVCERTGGEWLPRKANSPDSVAGGVQMFRRPCFEQIGGYKPLSLGGSDWLAQVEARATGWEVIALPQFRVFHFRPTSSADGRIRGLFRLGLLDASFGSHPIFEFFKCSRRVVEKPVLVGSVVRFSGYVWWKIHGREPLIPANAVAALRRDQVRKVKAMVRWPSN